MELSGGSMRRVMWKLSMGPGILKLSRCLLLYPPTCPLSHTVRWLPTSDSLLLILAWTWNHTKWPLPGGISASWSKISRNSVKFSEQNHRHHYIAKPAQKKKRSCYYITHYEQEQTTSSDCDPPRTYSTVLSFYPSTGLEGRMSATAVQ